MADSITLNFEIYRGEELLFKEQISAESVTIGKGPAAMLRIEDEGLADLQAVINLSDEGTVQILDLVGSGTKVNGDEVVNSELVSGDTIEIGEIRILVEMDGEVTATNPTISNEDDEVTDASVHTVGDIDFSRKSEEEILEEDISEDVMAFIMRSGTAQSEVGIDRTKPQVLEVAEIWGDVIMDVRHYHGKKAVTLGTSTGYKWYMLGKPLGWIGPGFAKVAWLVPPLLSEVKEETFNDFFVSSDSLPTEDFKVFVPSGNSYVCRFSSRWAGFVDIDGERKMLSKLVESGEAKKVEGELYEYPVTPGTRIVLDIGHVIVFGQMVHQSKKVPAVYDVDYPFLALLAFILFLGGLAYVQAHRTGDGYRIKGSATDIIKAQIDPAEETPQKDEKPKANPDAGEGAKAKKDEGKVGKKEAELEQAKGNKREVDQTQRDMEMVEDAGLMGMMNDMGGAEGNMGASVAEANLDGIGGVFGSKGNQRGAGGLAGRGDGMGGGGTGAGLGGSGTRGRGGGSSGFGKGGGNFGPKGEGGFGRIGGNPIIMGALDKSLIDRVIKQHMNQIKYCYQKQLNANPTLGGKVTVKFVITGDGTVSSAKTAKSTLSGKGASSVNSCINSRFLAFQFPKPKGGGMVIVRYPFIFQPQ